MGGEEQEGGVSGRRRQSWRWEEEMGTVGIQRDAVGIQAGGGEEVAGG